MNTQTHYLILSLLLCLSLVGCNNAPDNTIAKAQCDEMFANINDCLYANYALGDSVTFVRENGEYDHFVVNSLSQKYMEYTSKRVVEFVEAPTYIVGIEAAIRFESSVYQLDIQSRITIDSPYTQQESENSFTLWNDTLSADAVITDLPLPQAKDNEQIIAGKSHIYMDFNGDVAAYCVLRKGVGVVEIRDQYGHSWRTMAQ